MCLKTMSEAMIMTCSWAFVPRVKIRKCIASINWALISRSLSDLTESQPFKTAGDPRRFSLPDISPFFLLFDFFFDYDKAFSVISKAFG